MSRAREGLRPPLLSLVGVFRPRTLPGSAPDLPFYVATKVQSVAHVLFLKYCVPGNVDVNTFASKRSELIGNSASVRKRRVIHIKPIRVSMRPPVAARIINYIKQERKGDMWLALEPLTAILLKYVSVRKLQVAILARSSREMSRTVPSCHEFAFQFGLAFFLDANNSKPIANTARIRDCWLD